MSQSSGDLLNQAFKHKCLAGTWLTWMLVKKRIPVEKLNYCIDQLEKSLTILRTIQDGARK